MACKAVSLSSSALWFFRLVEAAINLSAVRTLFSKDIRSPDKLGEFIR